MSWGYSTAMLLRFPKRTSLFLSTYIQNVYQFNMICLFVFNARNNRVHEGVWFCCWVRDCTAFGKGVLGSHLWIYTEMLLGAPSSAHTEHRLYEFEHPQTPSFWTLTESTRELGVSCQNMRTEEILSNIKSVDSGELKVKEKKNSQWVWGTSRMWKELFWISIPDA